MNINYRAQSYRFNQYYRQLGNIFEKVEIRAYTMLILSLLALSLFGYFTIRPTLTTVAGLRRQIDDARLVDNKLQEKIDRLQQAQTAYEEIAPDLGLVFAALPQEPKFPSFIKILERTAGESKITIDELNFQTISLSKSQTAPELPKNSLRFNLTLHGNYSGLMSFLKRLSGAERIVIVDKMGFTRLEPEILNLALSGQIFYVQ